MLLSMFGGALFGSGVAVLFLPDPPIYPKSIAAVFVVVGIVMLVISVASAAVCW